MSLSLPGKDLIAIADEHDFVAAFIRVIDKIDNSSAMAKTKKEKADQLFKANRDVIKQLGEAEQFIVKNRMDVLWKKYG